MAPELRIIRRADPCSISSMSDVRFPSRDLSASGGTGSQCGCLTTRSTKFDKLVHGVPPVLVGNGMALRA